MGLDEKSMLLGGKIIYNNVGTGTLNVIICLKTPCNNSSNRFTEIVKVNNILARIPDPTIGKVILRNVCQAFSPKSSEASSRFLSKPSNLEINIRTEKGKQINICPAVTVIKLNSKPTNIVKISKPTPMIISGKANGNIMKPNKDCFSGKKYLVIALATKMPNIVLIMDANTPTLRLAYRASRSLVLYHIVTYRSKVQSLIGNIIYCDLLKEKRGRNRTGI